MNTIAELQSWYLSQCNDDWEHQYGIRIDTLDNPGWTLAVELTDTTLSGRSFPERSYGMGAASETSGDNWLICKVEGDKFMAHGGPEKLEEMINAFLTWARAAA